MKRHILMAIIMLSAPFIAADARSAFPECNADNMGAIEFDAETLDLGYCNGTDFVSFKSSDSSFSTCDDYGLTAGSYEWVGDTKSIVFCDGDETWPFTAALGSGGCGAADPLLAGTVGTLQFHDEDLSYYLCDGSGWSQVGGADGGGDAEDAEEGGPPAPVPF